MAFDLRKNMADALAGWKARMAGTGVQSVYATVTAAALWPIAQAAAGGDVMTMMGFGAALGGSVGANLLANQLQHWKDEAAAARQIEALPIGDPVRTELDAVLEKLEVFALARAALPPGERSWFQNTLRDELQGLGNLDRFQIQLSGEGNVAVQGSGNTVVQTRGDGNVVLLGTGHEVFGPGATKATQRNILNTGSGAVATGGGPAVGAGGMAVAGNVNTVHIHQHQHGETATTKAAVNHELLERYLGWLVGECAPLRLNLIRDAAAGPANKPLGLASVYVDLNVELRLPSKLSLVEHLASGGKGDEDERRTLGLAAKTGDAEKETRLVAALEALAAHDALVLLGAPGTGKSTLVAYVAIGALGWVGAADARQKTQDLVKALERTDLRILARNPLLLTLMATLHCNRTRLPDDRADLYDAVVELLLERWNETAGAERGLLAALQVPTLKLGDLREVLAQLAFEAHAKQAGDEGLADIAEGDLLAALRPLLGNDTGKADMALEYIENRAGLLLGQGPRGRQRQYTFPHRTFQEYLAACHLAGRANFCEQASTLARSQPGHWREVLALAARQARPGRGVPAADALLYSQPVVHWRVTQTPAEADWRAAILAGEQLLEIGLAAIESRPEHRAVRERVARWLATLVAEGQLPPTDRARAGVVLGNLGDPRPGVGLRSDGLPDIGWIEIAPGPFPMGNDEAEAMGLDGTPRFACSLITKPYAIEHYLVSVAQYAAFVVAGGYEHEEYWTPDGWQWRQKEGGEGPKDYSEFDRLPNHPRVGVSWYEAAAYCRWLGEQLKLPVRLPSEADWERAARHTDARTYPWGNDESDIAQRCNVGESEIGHTSAVGMIPTGASVCGALDMVGNVWEWCGTKWLGNYQDYETRVSDALEGSGARVLRGGAFHNPRVSARCACRGRSGPRFRNLDVGFRVVASPFVSGI